MEYRDKKGDAWIFIVSIFFVICIPFINGTRENLGSNDFIKTIYGFPFDWLHIFANNGFSFLWIGFIGNILFFYLIIKILIWIYKKWLVSL